MSPPRKKRSGRKSSPAKSGRRASGGAAKLERRSCGAMAAHMMLLEQYPSFHARQFRLEQTTARKRARPLRLEELPVARIRTIVHVVYRTAAQNVKESQIRSQLKVLNADFRGTNRDRKKVPAVWKGLASDARIEFELHDITRTRTDRASFGIDDDVKRAADGGIAPIEPRKYLNLWVCSLGGGLLGYAQFPGGPAKTDGVVINYRAFGTSGTAEAPFKRGRTATHEVGHYLNLRHIWGDTDDCSGSDLVADTPNCAGPNYDTPTFPVVTCNNGPDGDMFMNYMDYVDDAAMFMFTAQQVVRMRVTLDAARRGIW